MGLHSLSGVISNLRVIRGEYHQSKFSEFEGKANEIAPLMLAAIGDDATALNSALANDPDRVRPKLPEGYWIEVEVGERSLKGWFESIPFDDGDKVRVVFNGAGELVAASNPARRIIVFMPGLPEILKKTFNRQMIYAFLAVTSVLCSAEMIIFYFAFDSFESFVPAIRFGLMITVFASALLFILAFRIELIRGLKTKKILKLLELRDVEDKMKEEYDGVRTRGYRY